MTTRTCGDCQLCCKLLPVHDRLNPRPDALNKKAGVKCQYQKFGKGCTIYRTTKMPMCCSTWNCRWLVGEVPDYIHRPDRSHYVIDIMPDFVTLDFSDGTPKTSLEVVQIWIDPKYPDAHRDPDLREWLLELGERGIVGLIRYNDKDATTIFPPNM